MGPAPMIRMVEMSVRLGIKSHGCGNWAQKKGALAARPLATSVRETLARGCALDQFPHLRNPKKGLINGEIQGSGRCLPWPGFAFRYAAAAFATAGLPSRSCGAAKAGGPAWI